MRLFVAIHPDPATQAWLAETEARLRKELVRFDRELRWVDPISIHLTLTFLGEIAEAAPVVQALEGCHCARMDLTVSSLGVFPNPRRPSVLWVGVTEPTGALAALQAEIARALTPFVEPERRRFEPHLTLARIKGGHPGPAIAKALSAAGGDAPGPWHVESFSLMQSQLSEGGARHSVVREFGSS